MADRASRLSRRGLRRWVGEIRSGAPVNALYYAFCSSIAFCLLKQNSSSHIMELWMRLTGVDYTPSPPVDDEEEEKEAAVDPVPEDPFVDVESYRGSA